MEKLGKKNLFLGLIALSFIITLLISPIAATSKSISPTHNQPEVSQNNTTQIAQLFTPSRYQKLAEADNFYKQGNLEMARELQREVKAEFVGEASIVEPVLDTENMKPAVKVYWRMANEGMEQGLESKIFAPLELLTEKHPEFIPGQMLYVEALLQEEETDAAIEVLEKVTSLYPQLKEPLDKKIILLSEEKRWLEAAIAARLFAMTYPDDPDAPQYLEIAEAATDSYEKYMEQELIGMGLSAAILSTMAGNSSQNTTLIDMLIQGEAVAGDRLAPQYLSQLSLVEDPQIVNYVNEVGYKLAKVMGRDDFNYQFFVVKDDSPNAFALPGGKIFINTGILELMQSEAELAGLLGHEISHTVLSHGFQKMVTAATLESFTQVIPMVDILAQLGNSEYSREKEREADILGTRVLAANNYAADGLHSVMGIFKQLEGDSQTPAWFSSHPAPAERIEYLEALIESNGYNRYAYEGVEPYQAVFGKRS